MATRLNQRVGEEIKENLFNQNTPVADTFTVALRAGQGLIERGSALGKSATNDMVLLGSAGVTLTANCVLADTVDTGTGTGPLVKGLAYRTGHFNTNKLKVAAGYTITAADKEAFRTVGILLSDAFDIGG